MRAFAWTAIALCGCTLEEEVPPIRGEHESYVISRHRLPVTNTQARELALDINGDGILDNQFGMVLSTLAGMNTLQSQIRSDGAIDRGDLIQLIDLQRPAEDDLTAAAGFTLQVGRDPQPVACSAADDLVCRGHLDGTGSFALERVSGELPLHCVQGDVGRECLAGRMPLLLGILGTPLRVDAIGFPPVEIGLLSARATFEDVGDGTLRGRIAGGVTLDDLFGKIVPSFLVLIDADVRHDCTDLASPPFCGCAQDSAGRTYVAFFDTDPKDCSISLDEFKNNSLIVSLLAPEMRIDGKDVLALGIGFDAVPATIR